jgi:hypothetical protein
MNTAFVEWLKAETWNCCVKIKGRVEVARDVQQEDERNSSIFLTGTRREFDPLR